MDKHKEIDDLDILLEELDGKEKAAPEERPLNQEDACGFLDSSQRHSNTYLYNDDTNRKNRPQNSYPCGNGVSFRRAYQAVRVPLTSELALMSPLHPLRI